MAPGVLHQLRRHTLLGNPANDRKGGKGLFAIPERKSEGNVDDDSTANTGLSRSGRSSSRKKPRSQSEAVRKNPFVDDEDESDDSQPSAHRGVKFMDLKGPAPIATARDEYEIMVEEYEEEIQRLEKVNATLTANVSTLAAAALDSDGDGVSSMGQVSVITIERCKGCGMESCSEAEEGSTRSSFMSKGIHGMEITPNDMYTPLNNDIYNDMILTEEHYLHQISKLQKNNAKLQRRLDNKKKLVSQLSMNLKTAAEKITEVGKENKDLKTKVEKEKEKPQPQDNSEDLEQIHRYQVQVLENELKGLMNLVGERAKIHEQHRQALLDDYRRDDATWKKKMEKPEDTLERVVRRLRKGDVVNDWHINAHAASTDVRDEPLADVNDSSFRKGKADQAKPGFSVLDSVTSLFGGSGRQQQPQQPQPQPRQNSILRKERVTIDEHPMSEEIKAFDKRNLRHESPSAKEESDESSSGSSSESSSSESESEEEEEGEEESVESMGRLAVSAPRSTAGTVKAMEEAQGSTAPVGGADSAANADGAEFDAMRHRVFGQKDHVRAAAIAPPSASPNVDESSSDDESSSEEESSSDDESSSGDESEDDSHRASPDAPMEELSSDEQNPSHVGDVVLDAWEYDKPVTTDTTTNAQQMVGDPQAPVVPPREEENHSDTHIANEAGRVEEYAGQGKAEGIDETVDGPVSEHEEMEKARLLDEKIREKERLATEKAEQKRLERERQVAEKAEMLKQQAEERLREEQRLAAEQAEQERLERERRIAEKEELLRQKEEELLREEERLAALSSKVTGAVGDKAAASIDAMEADDSDGEYSSEEEFADGNTEDGYTAQEAEKEDIVGTHKLESAAEDSDDEYNPKEGKDDSGSVADEEPDAADVPKSKEAHVQEVVEEANGTAAPQTDDTGEAHLDTNLVDTITQEQNKRDVPAVDATAEEEPTADKHVPTPSNDATTSDGPSGSGLAPKLADAQQGEHPKPSSDLQSAKSHTETITTSAAAISEASQVRVSAALELRYNATNKTLADTLAMIQEQSKARLDGDDEDRSANQYHNVLSQFTKPESANAKKNALTNRLSRRQLFKNNGLTPADLSADSFHDNLHKTEDRQVLVTSRDIDKYQVPRYKPPALPPDTKSSTAPSFKKGLKDGYYVYRSSSGNTYAGQWKSGKRHGHGRAKYRDGEVYDGEWRGGRRHGRGVLHLANSEVFDGSWSANKKHGLGVYYWADGEVDVSWYEEDVRLESLRWTKDRRRAYLLDLSSSKKEQISLVRAASVVKGWERKDATHEC